MNGQKTNSSRPYGRWFNKELKLLLAFFGLISFSNFVFSNNTFALFAPTLSASVDNTAALVNGNQVINSTNKTTEIPLNLTVNTNNKTGYTATLNSETNETALVNNDSAANTKINSISANLSLNNLPNNTWGYKFGANTNYAPIPALSTPAQILQTAEKTNGNESNQLSIGMKLSNNLESGRYTNKLIFSILTNNYDHIAIMTEGPDFNAKLKALETATNKIEHFKKSPIPPVVYMNTVTIDDEESDYEIKLWLDPTDKTAYYYTETEKVYLNEDMNSMFRDMSSLTSLNLSSFDTSKVTNMSLMFDGVSSLTTLDLSSFDTSKVTNMSSMFYGVSNLTTLNLSNFDTSKVTNMLFMFSKMRNLTAIDLSSFDTSKVTNMRAMFSGVSNLTTINLSNFDTSKVTDMDFMFNDMRNLTTLNLSSFNTSSVTSMGYMFSGMTNLTTLNLSNFNTSQVTNMQSMFSFEDKYILKDKLEAIYVNNDFNTAKLVDFSEMFKNRRKLRGGAGSYLTNPSTADKSWLRIDDPTNGRPGYFTRTP